MLSMVDLRLCQLRRCRIQMAMCRLRCLIVAIDGRAVSLIMARFEVLVIPGFSQLQLIQQMRIPELLALLPLGHGLQRGQHSGLVRPRAS